SAARPAGAGGSDLEGGEVLERLAVVDADLAHPGAVRARAAPGDHTIDRVGRAFEDRLDLTAVQVADPAADAPSAGLVRGGVTEADTLDAAGDPDVGAPPLSHRDERGRR